MSRSANFSAAEVEILLNELENYPSLISGTFNYQIPTKKHQRQAWENIAKKINACNLGTTKRDGTGTAKRDGLQLRSKWSDLKHRTRQKASNLSSNSAGSGGPQNPLTALELKVLSLIGEKPSKRSFSLALGEKSTSSPIIEKVFSAAEVSKVPENKRKIKCEETENSLNFVELDFGSSSDSEKEADTSRTMGSITSSTSNSTKHEQLHCLRKRRRESAQFDEFEKQTLEIHKKIADSLSVIASAVTLKQQDTSEIKNLLHKMNTNMETLLEKMDKSINLLKLNLNINDI